LYLNVFNTSSQDGKTVLPYAAEHGHDTCLRYILYFIDEKSVQKLVNAVEGFADRGMTALMWAAKNGHESCVELLLNWKASSKGIKDDDGKTALDLASTDDIKALLQAR
jgi:ankyrin repeat protein